MTKTRRGSKKVLHLGAPHGTDAAAIEMAVHKFGRTTTFADSSPHPIANHIGDVLAAVQMTLE